MTIHHTQGKISLHRIQYGKKGENEMEIERVNEFTIKFFITYRDIEDRGFDREEIWSDRERGKSCSGK